MGESVSINTSLVYENGQTKSLFEGHPDIQTENLMRIKENPQAWTPPNLFIASVESCFFLTLMGTAKKMRVDIVNYSSTAEGVISSDDGTHKQFSQIIIKPKIKIADESQREKLPKLCELAEEYCYVVRSIKTPVKLDLSEIA